MTKEELEKQTMEWKNNYILKLEKRCANYEMVISKMEKGVCDICKETEKDKQIEELEHENVELKAQLESERDLPAIAYMQGAEKQKKKDAEQLTKAKELLKGIIDTPMYYQMGGEMYESEEYKELTAEAEQFLKDVEQPKMSAYQVPAPEPPKMEMVTESYNPLKFIKEEMKDDSSLIKESE